MVFITNKSICLYRNTGVFFVLMMCWLVCSAQSGNNSMYDYSSKVDSVLSLMTLDEKIGQLNQYTGNWQATRSEDTRLNSSHNVISRMPSSA